MILTLKCHGKIAPITGRYRAEAGDRDFSRNLPYHDTLVSGSMKLLYLRARRPIRLRLLDQDFGSSARAPRVRRFPTCRRRPR